MSSQVVLSKEDGRSVNVAGDGTARTSWTMAVKSKVLVATIAAEFLERTKLCSYTPREATCAEECDVAVPGKKEADCHNQTTSELTWFQG